MTPAKLLVLDPAMDLPARLDGVRGASDLIACGDPGDALTHLERVEVRAILMAITDGTAPLRDTLGAFEAPVIAVLDTDAEEAHRAALDAGAHATLDRAELGGSGLLRALDVAERAYRLHHQLADTRCELDRFVSLAAKDLKNPLRAVRALANFVLDLKGGRDLHPMSRKHLDGIVSKTSHMTALIEDLLAYARLGQPHEVTLEPTSLDDVVQRTLTRLRRVIDARKARIAVGSLPTVMADPALLAQLFDELVGNAVKFNDHRVPCILISALELGDYVRVTVQDNGIGIDEGHLDAIFTPLTRLHSQLRYPGTGLGLAVCRRVVDRHGGRLWVRSETDRGAAFHFTLRVAPAAVDRGTIPVADAA